MYASLRARDLLFCCYWLTTHPITECSCDSYDLYMLGVIGWYTGRTALKSNEFQRYDFAEKKWSQVDDSFSYDRRWQPLLFPIRSRVNVKDTCLHRSNYAVATFKGQIWLLGGCMRKREGGELTCKSQVFSYDLHSKKWAKELSMANPRADFCAVVVGDSLYAIGGAYYSNTKTTGPKPTLRRGVEEFQAYQQPSGRWRPRATMLNSRSRFASCAVGERIYVSGGNTFEGSGYHFTGRVEYYTVSRDEWISVTGMPHPRKDFRLVLVNDRMYAVGGDDAGTVIWNKSTLTSSPWSEPICNHWSAPVVLPAGLSSYEVFALGGDIYVVGSRNSNAIFKKLRLADYSWEEVNNLPSTSWGNSLVQVALIKNRPCENARR